MNVHEKERINMRIFSGLALVALGLGATPAVAQDDAPMFRDAMEPQTLIESGVEDALDEARWGVVAASGFPLMTGCGPELELSGIGVEPRVQLEERLVDATEFFCSKIAIVDGTKNAVLLRVRQLANGPEEIGVGDVGFGEIADSITGPKEAAKRWEAKLQTIVVAAELLHDDL